MAAGEGEPALRLLERNDGPLRIWRMPSPRERYCIGIDTSSGKPDADFCAATVCEIESRALVATMRGRIDPTRWGVMCANLGWFFGTAMLAFEVWPSVHGLSAAMAARDRGYPMLYRRQMETLITHRQSDELGWATTERTKPRMIDYTRVALAEAYEIPDLMLLRELLGIKTDENGRSNCAKGQHDDLFVAYGITQRVCQLLVERGWQPPAQEDPKDWTQQWWSDRRRALEGGAVQGGRAIQPWTGT